MTMTDKYREPPKLPPILYNDEELAKSRAAWDKHTLIALGIIGDDETDRITAIAFAIVICVGLAFCYAFGLG
jgi:hypothetical protein